MNDTMCSWIRFNTVKILCYAKLFIDSLQCLSTFQRYFLNRNRKKNPKIHVKPQNTPNSQSNLEQEDKTEGITPLFQIILQSHSN